MVHMGIVATRSPNYLQGRWYWLVRRRQDLPQKQAKAFPKALLEKSSANGVGIVAGSVSDSGSP
jgi:hypothetical protein